MRATTRKFGVLSAAASIVTLTHALVAQVNPTRSYVELIEPETGCQVVLLGCLHGSTSSADDVRCLLTEKTDAIVLELCAGRLADLRRSAEAPAPVETSAFERYVNMVIKTNQKRGFSTAAAAAVLGGVSVLQTALSDFDPGLEFVTAMEIAREKECDLILADRTVEETLRRMGELPSTSVSMLQDLLRERSWERTFGHEAEVLKRAVFGDQSMKASHQVKMADVLTRNKAAVEDLMRMSLPPILLTLLTANILSDALEHLFPQEAALNPLSLITDVTLSSQDVLSIVAGSVGNILFQVLTLLAGYVILALPAVRIILAERDDYLTRGIQAACRLQTLSGEQPERIVAVLGLLHVNGVANQLLLHEKQNQ